MKFVDQLFGEHFPMANEDYEEPQDFDCLRQLLGQLEEMCGEWSDYSLKYTKNVAHACNNKTEAELGSLMSNVFQHCSYM